MKKKRTQTAVSIGGHELKLSNLEKQLFPDGFTKAGVIDYYAKMAPVLLPHLKGRPFTLKRYPEGSEGKYFYEKNCPVFRPRWLPTIRVEREKRTGEIHYCEVNGVAALVWIANLASIELHVLLSRRPRLDRPTAMAFDLDPGAPADIVDCCRVGLALKKYLEAKGLRSFAKTSGGKGLHVYVPLNTAVTFDSTKDFARAAAIKLERAAPDKITSNMLKKLRSGKVFIDWSQNDSHKTTVCVYSLRARKSPAVSTPVEWGEVERCAESGDASKLHFEAPDVFERVKRRGDLFADVLKLKQRLT